MGSKEKIYLDQEGVNELQAEIEDIKRKIQENNAGRKQAFDAGAGDGWDSPEYEEIQRQENLLFAQLKRQSDLLANAVIIEKEENSDLIDVGDIVDVNLVYGPNDEEEFTFRTSVLDGVNSLGSRDLCRPANKRHMGALEQPYL